jgi:hypothetical protein
VTDPKPDRNKTVRDPRGRFTVGCAPGPGRRPGRGPAAELRAALAEDLHPILQALRAKALEGDTAAIGLILSRLVAPLKPEEPATEIELPASGTLSDIARATIAAVAQGQVAPSQAASLIGALAAAARVVEVDELQARVQALEDATGAKR